MDTAAANQQDAQPVSPPLAPRAFSLPQQFLPSVDAAIRMAEAFPGPPSSESAWYASVTLLDTPTGELRQRFLTRYATGSYIKFVHGSARASLPLNDGDALRIALFGPTASGKSSLVNSMSRVLNDVKDFVPSATVLGRGRGRCTLVTEPFVMGPSRKAELGRVEFVDVNGCWHYGSPEIDVNRIASLFFGLVQEGHSLSDGMDLDEVSDMRLCKRERHERVHLVAVVIPAPTNDDSDDARHLSQVAYMLRVRRTNEPWLTRERVEEGVPQFLYSLGFPFVLILTHPNTAFGINGWSNLLLGPHPTVYGVDPSKTFYLDNYTDGMERDTRTDRESMVLLMRLVMEGELALAYTIRKSTWRHRAERLWQLVEQPVVDTLLIVFTFVLVVVGLYGFKYYVDLISE